MKTEFLTLLDKTIIVQTIIHGEHKDRKDMLDGIFKEIDRLESLVKGYELVIEQAVGRLESDLFKKPDVDRS